MSVDVGSWMNAAYGGVLIGVSATLLLLFNGRIAGVSGVLGSLASQGNLLDAWWKVLFLVGLVAGASLHVAIANTVPEMNIQTGWQGLAMAGLLVGVGTRMGNGCTSGHGICGMARISKRSMLATCTFMIAGAATVFILRHVLGES